MQTSETHSGPDAAIAGARLTIDLGALIANWQKLNAMSAPGKASAVVKANAYGLGVNVVVPALVGAGCDTFYVAQAHEGIEVRALAPDARIFVIYGAPKGAESALLEHRLTPLICTAEQLDRWGQLIRSMGKKLPYGLHVDTGMNRTGLTMVEAMLVGTHVDVLKASGLCHVMTHPACADDINHPMNMHQAHEFQMVREIFSGVESSFANSAAILSGKVLSGEITRPGIAIYGGQAVNDMPNPMLPVVTAEARIVQVRSAKAGETVSYGATETLAQDTKIAVCAVGYADGYHRASGNGVPLRKMGQEKGYGFLAGHKVPILGRVTMDFTMFDVTGVPDAILEEQEWVELFGSNIALDDAARAAGTIGYEMLTGLGSRYHRVVTR
ncbi:MAG: alanine racemase [Rhizobiaceae bacterium]